MSGGAAQAEGVVAVLAFSFWCSRRQCWRIGHEEKDNMDTDQEKQSDSRPSSPVRRIRLPLTKPLNSSLRCP